MDTTRSLKLLQLITATKYGLSGVIGSLVLLFTFYLTTQLATNISHQPDPFFKWFAVAFAVPLMTFFLIKTIQHRVVAYFKRLLYSKRIDIIFYFIAGFSFPFISNSFEAVDFYVGSLSLNPSRTLLYSTTLTLSIFYLIYLIASYKINIKNTEPYSSYFLDDNPINSHQQDLLNFSDYLSNIEIQIENGRSRSSLVLGIDAPWGDGKTSFINLLENKINKSKKRFIFCRVNALKCGADTNISYQIAKNINSSIQKTHFHPELQTLFDKLLNYIDQSVGVELYGIKVKLPNLYDEKTILSMIEYIISDLDFTIVVVIDDLDRLDPDQFKSIIHSTKELFDFSNTRFILAFDTYNLSKYFKNDLDAMNFYLEKFINVKFSLFQKPDYLTALVNNFCLRIITKGKNNKNISNISLNYIANHLNLLLTDEFTTEYTFLIGNARKIKRLINTIAALNMANLNFSSLDFDPRDVIHLLLLQLNYPDVFRKIIQLEYNNTSGQLTISDYSEISLESQRRKIRKFIKGNKYSKNSIFLLKKIFSDPLKQHPNIDEKFRKTKAIYNRSHEGQGNLSRYIDLIISPQKSIPSTTYMANLNSANKFIDNQNGFTRYLQSIPSSTPKLNEREVIRLILEEPHKLNFDTKNEIVDHILLSTEDYSYLFFHNFRKMFLCDLARIIDSFAYNFDAMGNNTPAPERVKEVLFGIKSSVFRRLYNKATGVFGLMDLLIFRLEISPNRSHSDFSNITRALADESSYDCTTSGLVDSIAISCLREVSQNIYAVFKSDFVDTSRNLINEIFDLDPTSLLAKEFEIDGIPEEDFLSAKQALMIFITYQLGNIRTSGGISIGFYDLEGDKDHHQIHEDFNSYLFENCFNIAECEGNHEVFVSFCLIRTLSLVRQYSSGKLSEEAFKGIHDVLSKEKTIEYWKSESEAITKLIRSKGLVIKTSYGTEVIKEAAEVLLSYLDSLITSTMNPNREDVEARQTSN